MTQSDKPWLFYIINADDEYYYIDSNGDVDTSVDKKFLSDAIYGWARPAAPEKWQEAEITWERSDHYWGLFRNYTNEFIFHGEAKTILNHIYFTEGVIGNARLVIEQLDEANDTSSVQYLEYYRCHIDFSQYKETDKGVQVALMEGGLRDLITARETTEYDIPIESGDRTVLVNDGIVVSGNQPYTSVASNDTFTGPGQDTIMPFVPGESEGEYPFGESRFAFDDDGATALDGNYVFRFYFDIIANVNIDTSVTFNVDASSSTSAQLEVRATYFAFPGDTSPANNVIYTSASVAPGASTTFQVVGSDSQLVTAGTVLVIRCQPIAGGAVNGVITFGEGTLRVHAFSLTPTTSTGTYTLNQVGEKLTDKMTGGAYNFSSSFLTTDADKFDSSPTRTVLTGGRALRATIDGDAAEQVMRTSWADYYKAVSSDFCLGAYIENNDTLCIEHLSEILKDSELLDLGPVDNLEIEPYTKGMFSSIKVGYNTQEFDTPNGKYAFNNTSKFTTVLTPINNELDLTSPYKFEAYEIEKVRYNYEGKPNVDSKNDNTIYGFEIVYDAIFGYYLVRRNQNLVGRFINGILTENEPRVYNIEKSPMRVILRNMPRIQSALHLHPSSHITFQTAEKNSLMESYIGSSGFYTIAENGLINSTILKPNEVPDEKLFIPILGKCKVVIPKNIISVLNANSKGYFKFQSKGIDLKFYPMRVSKKPVYNNVHDVSGLFHPSTSLADLKLAINL